MLRKIKKLSFFAFLGFLVPKAHAAVSPGPTIAVDQNALGFAIPNFSTILTFIIRGFFIVAGLLALLYLLLGALAWVTSGGNKENVDKARDKITAAIVGVIIIVAVLAVVVTLEQMVFKQAICFGLSCGIKIPGLLNRCGPVGSGLPLCPTLGP